MHNSTNAILLPIALLITIVATALFSFADAEEDQARGSLFVVHFSTGPSWDQSKPPGDQDGFSEHSANLRQLRTEGTILFGARYGEFGMIIVRASSLEAANELIESDPGVQSGIFVFTVVPINVFYEWKDGG